MFGWGSFLGVVATTLILVAKMTIKCSIFSSVIDLSVTKLNNALTDITGTPNFLKKSESENLEFIQLLSAMTHPMRSY